VTAAASYVGAAQAAYAGAEPSVSQVFEAIEAAVGELGQIREPQGRRFQAQLAMLVTRLARVARRIAADTTALAVAAGASPAVIAEAHLARGDDAVALGLFGPAVGAYADAFAAAAGGIVLDLDLLENNIRAALDGETVGYAYVIARDGVLHATSNGVGGLARRSVDPDETPQSPGKEMYTASISKTVSATALLKALHDGGISVDEAIGAYLPVDWEQGEDLELVTFRHLLTHTSGLDPADLAGGGATPQTDASLQTFIADGSSDTQRGNHNYRNANYSLLRVLLPRVVYGGLVDVLAATWGPEAVHAGLYEYYVSQNVLAPAGISQNQCQPAESATTRTLLYPFPPGDANGLDAGDWSFSCGATGWFLSALDLGAFLAHLRFTDNILEPATRALMDEAFLGWLDPVAYAAWVQGTWGTYRAHAGDFTNMTGCIMNFPSAANPDFPGVKVQVSLLVNSTGGTLGGNLPITGPRRICKVLKVAYDEAWVAQ
jgi:CubicO group peptidase (beta-lactamase class C family)